MKKTVTISIDGKSYSVKEGENILQIAKENEIDIPHFCYHEDLEVDANCRVCLVQLANTKEVRTSCTVLAKEGLEILTTTSKVDRLRKKNMEFLLASHKQYCPKCKNGYFCHVAEDMKKYDILGNTYIREQVHEAVHKMGTAAEFDPELCIACNRCIKTCHDIGIDFLQLKGKNSKTRVTYNTDPKVDCIYCGQCTLHCPVGAIREQSQLEKVEEILQNKEKIVIVQTAPSVRSSIGEEFGTPIGTDLTGQLYTAYRKLGFDKIFDVNMGADITTWVEAEELKERIIEGKHLPMFTSCCPGWVKYMEFYHPELLPNLTTARSPQIHSGGAYKTWWAKKEDVDPKNIVVVSIMPCTSKKYEARQDKLNINGHRPVDYVLTTRETAALMKKHNIDLPSLSPTEVDYYGKYTGAAAIYGASGGVMESALRTAYYFITGEELEDIEFKEVRGMKGVKRASVKIGDQIIRLGIAATAKNIQKILKELKKDPNAFHYIEVMACPGGCIGGGGQPYPTTKKIIKKRIASLYKIDKKKNIRKAHLNPVVQDFFQYIENISEKKKESLLYTTYSPKKKFQ
jgi:iron-only hydrogenase group A